MLPPWRREEGEVGGRHRHSTGLVKVSMNGKDRGAFLSHVWMLQKQRSQKPCSAKIRSQCLSEISLPIYKVYVLLSYTFQGNSSLFNCFVFSSLFLCRENKISNINVTFEMILVAKGSMQSVAPGQRGRGEERRE